MTTGVLATSKPSHRNVGRLCAKLFIGVVQLDSLARDQLLSSLCAQLQATRMAVMLHLQVWVSMPSKHRRSTAR